MLLQKTTAQAARKGVTIAVYSPSMAPLSLAVINP